jgi:hypothetical protein
METLDDLSSLAKKLNPIVPRFDPLGLSTSNFWGTTQEETIGFLRESEVKHGRIAMFAFVGYIVHANGITWPWPMMLDGTPFPKVSSAPEAWDAIPDSAKLQIFLFIGFLEYVSILYLGDRFQVLPSFILSEIKSNPDDSLYNNYTRVVLWQWREANSEKHYMKGGKIGEFPAFNDKYIPGGALNLYDPFGWHKNRSEEAKAAGLVKEINNGRLAMLGIFGFICEQKIPGSVPLLKGVVPPYDGEFMAPFTKSIFPEIPSL